MADIPMNTGYQTGNAASPQERMKRFMGSLRASAPPPAPAATADPLDAYIQQLMQEATTKTVTTTENTPSVIPALPPTSFESAAPLAYGTPPPNINVPLAPLPEGSTMPYDPTKDTASYRTGTLGALPMAAPSANAKIINVRSPFGYGAETGLAPMGQYIKDTSQPGTGIKQERQEASSWKERELLRQGLSPNMYEIDHIQPLFAGGTDAPENMEILTKSEHNLKSNIQAIPYTLMTTMKPDGSGTYITPTQAMLMSQQWRSRTWDDYMQRSTTTGTVPIDYALQKYNEWNNAPKVGIKQIIGGMPAAGAEVGKSIADFFGAGKKAQDFASGFGTGVANAVTLGWAKKLGEKWGTYETPKVTESKAGKVGEFTGQIASDLLMFTAAVGAITKGVGSTAAKIASTVGTESKLYKGAKTLETAMAASGRPNPNFAIASELKGGKILKGAAKGAEEIPLLAVNKNGKTLFTIGKGWTQERKLALYREAAIFPVISQLYAHPEDTTLGDRVEEVVMNGLLGGVVGTAGYTARDYAKVFGMAAGVAGIETGMQDPAAILQSGIMMTAFHGLGNLSSKAEMEYKLASAKTKPAKILTLAMSPTKEIRAQMEIAGEMRDLANIPANKRTPEQNKRLEETQNFFGTTEAERAQSFNALQDKLLGEMRARTEEILKGVTDLPDNMTSPDILEKQEIQIRTAMRHLFLGSLPEESRIAKETDDAFSAFRFLIKKAGATEVTDPQILADIGKLSKEENPLFLPRITSRGSESISSPVFAPEKKSTSEGTLNRIVRDQTDFITAAAEGTASPRAIIVNTPRYGQYAAMRDPSLNPTEAYSVFAQTVENKVPTWKHLGFIGSNGKAESVNAMLPEGDPNRITLSTKELGLMKKAAPDTVHAFADISVDNGTIKVKISPDTIGPYDSPDRIIPSSDVGLHEDVMSDAAERKALAAMRKTQAQEAAAQSAAQKGIITKPVGKITAAGMETAAPVKQQAIPGFEQKQVAQGAKPQEPVVKPQEAGLERPWSEVTGQTPEQQLVKTKQVSENEDTRRMAQEIIKAKEETIAEKKERKMSDLPDEDIVPTMTNQQARRLAENERTDLSPREEATLSELGESEKGIFRADNRPTKGWDSFRGDRLEAVSKIEGADSSGIRRKDVEELVDKIQKDLGLKTFAERQRYFVDTMKTRISSNGININWQDPNTTAELTKLYRRIATMRPQAELKLVPTENGNIEYVSRTGQGMKEKLQAMSVVSPGSDIKTSPLDMGFRKMSKDLGISSNEMQFIKLAKEYLPKDANIFKNDLLDTIDALEKDLIFTIGRPSNETQTQRFVKFKDEAALKKAYSLLGGTEKREIPRMADYVIENFFKKYVIGEKMSAEEVAKAARNRMSLLVSDGDRVLLDDANGEPQKITVINVNKILKAKGKSTDILTNRNYLKRCFPEAGALSDKEIFDRMLKSDEFGIKIARFPQEEYDIRLNEFKSILDASATDGKLYTGMDAMKSILENTGNLVTKTHIKPVLGYTNGDYSTYLKGDGIPIRNRGMRRLLETIGYEHQGDTPLIVAFDDNVKIGKDTELWKDGVLEVPSSSLYVKSEGPPKGTATLSYTPLVRPLASEVPKEVKDAFRQKTLIMNEALNTFKNALNEASLRSSAEYKNVLEKMVSFFDRGEETSDIFDDVRATLAKKNAGWGMLNVSVQKMMLGIERDVIGKLGVMNGRSFKVSAPIDALGPMGQPIKPGEIAMSKEEVLSLLPESVRMKAKKDQGYLDYLIKNKKLPGKLSRSPQPSENGERVVYPVITEEQGNLGMEHVALNPFDTKLVLGADNDGDGVAFHPIGDWDSKIPEETWNHLPIEYLGFLEGKLKKKGVHLFQAPKKAIPGEGFTFDTPSTKNTTRDIDASSKGTGAISAIRRQISSLYDASPVIKTGAMKAGDEMLPIAVYEKAGGKEKMLYRSEVKIGKQSRPLSPDEITLNSRYEDPEDFFLNVDGLLTQRGNESFDGAKSNDIATKVRNAGLKDVRDLVISELFTSKNGGIGKDDFVKKRAIDHVLNAFDATSAVTSETSTLKDYYKALGESADNIEIAGTHTNGPGLYASHIKTLADNHVGLYALPKEMELGIDKRVRDIIRQEKSSVVNKALSETDKIAVNEITKELKKAQETYNDKKLWSEAGKTVNRHGYTPEQAHKIREKAYDDVIDLYEQFKDGKDIQDDDHGTRSVKLSKDGIDHLAYLVATSDLGNIAKSAEQEEKYVRRYLTIIADSDPIGKAYTELYEDYAREILKAGIERGDKNFILSITRGESPLAKRQKAFAESVIKGPKEPQPQTKKEPEKPVKEEKPAIQKAAEIKKAIAPKEQQELPLKTTIPQAPKPTASTEKPVPKSIPRPPVMYETWLEITPDSKSSLWIHEKNPFEKVLASNPEVRVFYTTDEITGREKFKIVDPSGEKIFSPKRFGEAEKLQTYLKTLEK